MVQKTPYLNKHYGTDKLLSYSEILPESFQIFPKAASDSQLGGEPSKARPDASALAASCFCCCPFVSRLKCIWSIWVLVTLKFYEFWPFAAFSGWYQCGVGKNRIFTLHRCCVGHDIIIFYGSITSFPPVTHFLFQTGCCFGHGSRSATSDRKCGAYAQTQFQRKKKKALVSFNNDRFQQILSIVRQVVSVRLALP